MTADREKILQALAEKPLTLFSVAQRVNIRNQEDCLQLSLKMRDEKPVKFDIKDGK